jgi:hypothetical protein
MSSIVTALIITTVLSLSFSSTRRYGILLIGLLALVNATIAAALAVLAVGVAAFFHFHE